MQAQPNARNESMNKGTRNGRGVRCKITHKYYAAAGAELGAAAAGD